MNLLTATVGRCLSDRVTQQPMDIALVEHDSGRALTWSALNEEVDRVARGLLASGLRKGGRLGLWSPNSLEWVICFFAAAKIGVAVFCISFHFKEKEMQHLLQHSVLDALCFAEGFRDTNFYRIIASLAEAKPQHSCLPRYLICLGKKRLPGTLMLAEMKTRGESINEAVYNNALQQPDSHDLLTLLLTSGSTAVPKRVMLNHYSVINNAMLSASRLGVVRSDTLCLAIPLFHCFGLSSGLFFSLLTGCRLVLLQNYHSGVILQAVQRYRCSVLHGVPTIFSRLIRDDALAQYDISTLDKGIVAGSPCNSRLLSDIKSLLGMAHIAVSWGQTETSPCCTQTRFESAGAVEQQGIGQPLPFIEMKIVAPETGNDCPPGVKGELCTRGFHVMMGYDNAAEQIQDAIDKQGWLHTGDIGFVDDAGNYHYLWRIKEIIVRGGENISPGEIEESMLEYDAINAVCVFGVASDEFGEEVAAAICIKPEYRYSTDALYHFLRQRLAHYKVPTRLYYLDKFPLTPCGKVDVRKIRALTGEQKIT